MYIVSLGVSHGVHFVPHQGRLSQTGTYYKNLPYAQKHRAGLSVLRTVPEIGRLFCLFKDDFQRTVTKSSFCQNLAGAAAVGTQGGFCLAPMEQMDCGGNFRQGVIQGVQVVSVPPREGEGLGESSMQRFPAVDASAVDCNLHQGSP